MRFRVFAAAALIAAPAAAVAATTSPPITGASVALGEARPSAAAFWAFAVDGVAPDDAVWSRPGAAPCRQADGSNPCLEGDALFAAATAGQDEGAGFRAAAFRRGFAEGRLRPSAICDGDVVANSGAKNGRAFFVARQAVRFDRRWLAERAVVHHVAADGRVCVPTLAYAEWHYADVCGNVLRLLADGAPVGATPARPVAPRRFEDALLRSAGLGRGAAAAASAPFGGGSVFAAGAVFASPASGSAAAALPPTPPLDAPVASPALVAAIGSGSPPGPPPPAAAAFEPEAEPPAIPPPPAFVAIMTALALLGVFWTRGSPT